MKNFLFFYFLILFCFTTQQLFSQVKPINCEGNQPIKGANDNLKLVVYRAVGIVRGASTKKISIETKKKLENEYNELKIRMNTMYQGIRDNTTIFSNPSTICELFYAQLKGASGQCYDYTKKIDQILKKPIHGSGGNRNIGELIDFLINLANETRGAVFYSQVRWNDWKSIPPITE